MALPVKRGSNSLLAKLVLLPGLSCESVGGNFRNANSFAAAWYLYYTAAHIMDSVQDKDEPEDWWREKDAGYALNVASGLYFTAAQILNNYCDTDSTSKIATKIIWNFNETFVKMCGGQHLGIVNHIHCLDDYWKVAGLKSGAFFELACWSGAVLGTNNAKAIEGLSSYGYYLGIIIQILDDLEDLQKAKIDWEGIQYSLPFIYYQDVVSAAERDRFKEKIRAAENGAIDKNEIWGILENSGVVDYLLIELNRYANLSLKSLEEANVEGLAAENLKQLIILLTSTS